MRPRNVLAFSISLILAAPVLAQPSGKAKANTAPKAGPGQPVFMPAGDLKWTDLDPERRSRSQGRGSVGRPCQGGVRRVLQASGGIRRSASHAHPRHEGRVPVGHVHPGAGRKSGGAARSGFLHDAARRELPAHDLLRQGLGMPVLCRKRRSVRPQAGGGGKGTREEVAAKHVGRRLQWLR